MKRKIFFTLTIFCLFVFTVQSQSTLEFESGTTIEVTAGADICADTIHINGTYSGTGTKCNGPLPVELSSFTASVLNTSIVLNWRTETEVNNYGFEIERALKNPRSEIQNPKFERIGFVDGNGNSNSPKEYSYTDKYLTGGTNLTYRLKQIDHDGKYEYSKEVEVLAVPAQFVLFQNYPNPFNPSTNLKFNLPQESKVIITVYNILGEKIKTLLNQTLAAGFHKIKFDADNYSSGTYIYRIEAQSSGEFFTQIRKMVLLK